MVRHSATYLDSYLQLESGRQALLTLCFGASCVCVCYCLCVRVCVCSWRQALLTLRFGVLLLLWVLLLLLCVCMRAYECVHACVHFCVCVACTWKAADRRLSSC